jgi:hypothetical protein
VDAVYRQAAELGLGLAPGPSLLRGLAQPVSETILQQMQHSRNDAIVFTACLVPDHGLPAAELVKLAQPNVQATRSADYLETLGAAQYRAGQYADACKTLEAAVKLHGKGGTNWMKLFLAMAYQRDRQAEQARAWFDRARLARGAGWEERLIHARLRAEAARLLEKDR